MMKFIQKNMTIVGILVIIALGLIVYLNFFAGNSSDELLITTEGNNSPVSQDLLTTLSNLHTIRLDNTIFSDPVFQSLTNFGVQIPPENVGRRNPFEPIGSN